MNLPAGTLLHGCTYKIIRQISSGGFGITYEAEHVMLQKRVAIKEFFVKDFCNRDDNTNKVSVSTFGKLELVKKLKKKFFDEAIAISHLEHPNIVRVTDVFEDNCTAYYVMDLINGQSLANIVKTCGPLTESDAVRYVRQVACALNFVHEHNRLHLDIKPANIMVNDHNEAILIDFGVSKQYDEINGQNTSTLIGYSNGFAPIEQMGNDIQTFSPATDIYSLGATLYFLLTGTIPPNPYVRVSGTAMKPLPKFISQKTRELVENSMQINRDRRSQNITDFLCIIENNVAPFKSCKCIDLGLSVRWSECNLDASSPCDIGLYFAWGEVTPKKVFNLDNYKYYDKVHNSWIDIGTSDISGSIFDIATHHLGPKWRMPTKVELEELINKCIWTWCKEPTCGYLIKGENGNSIFLPITGYMPLSTYKLMAKEFGVSGCYWSSELFNQSFPYYLEINDPSDCILRTQAMNIEVGTQRWVGLCVRPVSDY